MAAAGADAFARSRPGLSGLDATTTLRDFAIVTFRVEPGRLATLLPVGLAPEVRRLDDGREAAFV